GLWPLPEKTPLKAVKTGEVEAHGVVVEKLYFQSRPGLYVTANLYRPRAARAGAENEDRKYPAILYLCGHSGRGRDGNKSAFQDHGFWFANHGYVCLALDSLQLGEIPGIHHGTYGRTVAHFKAWGIDLPSAPLSLPPSPLLPKGADAAPFRPWWWSAGYTPAGVECWNGIRAIDYLLTRPEVDPQRIGVTGISGGGAATFWIAAADERVKVAVPVSGMSDLEYYVTARGINGHCDCMFLYNTYQWDWTTIAALVAPRPLLFANSDKDPIFPMDANRRIMAKLRACYRLFPSPSRAAGPGEGAAHLVEEYVSVGGHDYRPDLRRAVFRFFNKHLKGDTTTPVEDSDQYAPLPGKELRVFPTDADLPKDALNARIDETFVARAQAALPAAEQFAAWKEERLRELRQRCFRGLLDETLGPAIPLTNRARLVGQGQGPATMVVVEGSDFDALRRGEAFAQHVPGRDGTMVVYVADELLTWTKKSPPNYFERSQLLLGHTMDEHLVSQLIRAARQLAQAETGPPWNRRIVGKGRAGILAAYAALFEPSIKEVVVIDPPRSHQQGPHFLNILRVLDVPEALGLLAPTPLTLIGSADPAFERTAAIYRRAGAEQRLTRK
ncbi:MAG: prolyl oligopeptidase family serine peptidase, partial [Gemmataceae bacterium]|nr:prolyl oligopeptidase family serine peptidase [Gemmataceae bacterium]